MRLDIHLFLSLCCFFKVTATTEIYTYLHTLPLHDALPISDDRLRSDAGRTAALGFDGKWVIHPGQVASVTEAYTPTDEELARAREVLEALSAAERSEEHTSELQSLMRISYAVFCLKKKNTKRSNSTTSYTSHPTPAA